MTHIGVIIWPLNTEWHIYVGVIMKYANLSCFSGTTKLEQQLSLQGSCSNVRAFTRCIYPIFLSPAQQTIKWYHAFTVLLQESSRPYLRALGIHSGESQQRQTILRCDRYRLTFIFAPHTCINFTFLFLDRTARLYSVVLTQWRIAIYQQFSWITVISERILTVAVSTVKKGLLSVMHTDIGLAWVPPFGINGFGENFELLKL